MVSVEGVCNARTENPDDRYLVWRAATLARGSSVVLRLGAREVIAVDLGGNSEVILRAPSFPCCVDWLPDGRLLLVSARDGLLFRREPDGTLVTYGDLRRVSKPPAGNELVVDGRGNAYVNGGGFDLMAGDP